MAGGGVVRMMVRVATAVWYRVGDGAGYCEVCLNSELVAV